MEDAKLDKLLYTDKELRGMLGITARRLAHYRKEKLIVYIDTNPIRYTRKMIQDFLEYVNKYPGSLVIKNN
jgi:hypothetical protein